MRLLRKKDNTALRPVTAPAEPTSPLREHKQRDDGHHKHPRNRDPTADGSENRAPNPDGFTRAATAQPSLRGHAPTDDGKKPRRGESGDLFPLPGLRAWQERPPSTTSSSSSGKSRPPPSKEAKAWRARLLEDSDYESTGDEGEEEEEPQEQYSKLALATIQSERRGFGRLFPTIAPKPILPTDKLPPRKPKRPQKQEQRNEREQTRDFSELRRDVVFSARIRVEVPWKGLGMVDKTQTVEQVAMMRAADISSATKQMQAATGLNKRAQLGTVKMRLIQGKGLPRTNEDGSIDVAAHIRLYPSEVTTKPEYETNTDLKHGSDPLTKTLKVTWETSHAIEIYSEGSQLEIELVSQDFAGHQESMGSMRMATSAMPSEQEEENWWMLRRKDGSSRAVSIHVAFMWEPYVEDQEKLRIKMRKRLEAEALKTANSMPDWISAWDVRVVKQYEEKAAKARVMVQEALDDGSFEALCEVPKIVKEVGGIALEPKTLKAMKMYEEQKTLHDAQKLLIRRLKTILEGPRTNPFWVRRELGVVMLECEATQLDSNTDEVAKGLALLEWADERVSKKHRH